MQKDAAFLHKPFEVRELTEAVRAALGDERRAHGAGATRETSGTRSP
jgi:DNA-binding response OmpR family regulator